MAIQTCFCARSVSGMDPRWLDRAQDELETLAAHVLMNDVEVAAPDVAEVRHGRLADLFVGRLVEENQAFGADVSGVGRVAPDPRRTGCGARRQEQAARLQ